MPNQYLEWLLCSIYATAVVYIVYKDLKKNKNTERQAQTVATVDTSLFLTLAIMWQ